jgi:pimeloyl-ACP methyl ester carboxylesterase
MRVSTGRSELDVTVMGEGEPILFIHGAFFSDSFGGLFNAPVLRDHFKLIAYARNGYGNSSRPTEPYDLDLVTSDAVSVLRRTGVDRAHVVGHSLGGMYAMQVAMDHPEAVHSVTVIEPVLPTPAMAEFHGQHFTPAAEMLKNGESEAAFDRVFQPIYGSANYRAEMDPLLPPDTLDQCSADLAYLFMVESAVSQQFTFGPEEADRIHQPLLIIEGERTEPIFVSNDQYLKELVAHAELHIVPGVNHFCQVLKPGDTAQALSRFLASNRIEQSVGSDG